MSPVVLHHQLPASHCSPHMPCFSGSRVEHRWAATGGSKDDLSSGVQQNEEVHYQNSLFIACHPFWNVAGTKNCDVLVEVSDEPLE